MLRNQGRGILTFSVREICNIAYSIIVEDLEKMWWAQFSHPNTDLEKLGSIEETVERFEERIGLRINPEDIAMEQHKAMLKAKGIEWDNTPYTPDLTDPHADAGLDIEF